MFPRKFGLVEIERARVRFLFRDADFRQEIDQHLRLNLEFPGQLVNSNLIRICHQPLFSPCYSVLAVLPRPSSDSEAPSAPPVVSVSLAFASPPSLAPASSTDSASRTSVPSAASSPSAISV